MRGEATAGRLVSDRPVIDTPAPPAREESPTLSKRDVLLAYAGLVVAQFLASLYHTIFGTALPTIVGELDGVDQLLWVTTAYILASTVAMPVFGKFSDLIGRKSLFIAALGLFLAGSVLGALAQDITTLIIGRAVQGLGGGGLLVLPYAIIADVVPPRQRSKYMAFMGVIFGVSSVLGPVLGGWFTEDIGWRWAFWLNLPLGLLAIVAAAIFLKTPVRTTARPRVDVAGISVITVAVTTIVLTATWGGTTYAWTSPVILGLIAAAIASGLAFVLVERRAADPLIPLHLFRDRNFNLATIGALLLAIAMFGILSYMPTYLQMVKGVKPTGSGFLMLPMIGGLTGCSMMAGVLASRTGRYKWMPVTSTTLVALGLFLVSTIPVDAPLWRIGIYQFILGGGIGMGLPILTLIVQNSFPLREVGTATASTNFFREIGAALGAAVVGTLFTSRLFTLLATKAAATGEAGFASLDANALTPQMVNAMPEGMKSVVISSFNEALTPVYLYLVPLMVVGAILLMFVREKTLALTNEASGTT